MKYIRWTLNIIQFVIVFFIFFFILQEFDPFEQIFGYSFDFSTLNAGVSLIIAFSFRKIYNKASLSIMKITFFGYLPLKWKRLSRVLSFVLFPVFIAIWAEFIDDDTTPVAFILWIILIPLISYVLKPFVVKD